MRFIQWWPLNSDKYDIFGTLDYIPDPKWTWINLIPGNYDIMFDTLWGKRYLREGDFLILNKDGILFQNGKYLPDK